MYRHVEAEDERKIKSTARLKNNSQYHHLPKSFSGNTKKLAKNVMHDIFYFFIFHENLSKKCR